MRGVAVLGILYANIVAFGQPMIAAVWPHALPVPMDSTDRLVWLVQFLLIDGKMRGLFALLFGASLLLFVDSKGPELQTRRLLWLAAFGLAHYFFLFRGDILFSYAVCGLVVLAVGAHRIAAAPAIWTGCGLYLLGGALAIWPYIPLLPEEGKALAGCADLARCIATRAADNNYWAYLGAEMADAAYETQVMRGSWPGIAFYNLTEHASGPVWGAFMALLESFPTMLIGIGLYRAGLFSAIGGYRLLAWGVAGIVLGLILTWPLAAWLMRADDPLYLTFAVVLGPAQAARLPMVLGMATVLVWLAPRVAGSWLGQCFVAAGRMAFSNYIGTSLVMAVLFQGWGFGLYGDLGRTGLMVPMLAGCVLMLAWSRPWLKRFAFGPLEWAWRCLTYGRIFQLRRIDENRPC